MDEHSSDVDTRRPRPWRRRLVLAGILSLAAVLRLLALDKGIWQDEYGSLRLISGDNLFAALRAHNHPPLYYLVLKATSLLARDDSFLRLPSVVAGVGAVFCLWRWVSRYSQFGAACAALLAATQPLFVRYSQEMRMYGLLLLLTTLSFWLADEWRRNWSDWRLAAALTLVLVLAVSAHLIAVFVATAVLFYLAMWLLAERRRMPLTLLLPAAAVPLTFLFFTKVFLTAVYDPATWWMEPPSLALLGDIGRGYLGWPALAWLGEALHRGFAVIPPKLTMLLPGGLLLIVAAPRPRLADLLLLAAAVAMAVQLVLVSVLVVPVLVARTGLVVLVPTVAFIGVRLGRLRQGWARGLAIVIIAALAAIYSSWWLLVEGRQPFGRWKEVAEFLEPRLQPGDLVFISPIYTEGPLRHYLRRLPPGAVVAFQPDASPALVAQVRARLATLPAAGCRRVWQVVREDQNVRRKRDGLDAVQVALTQGVGAPAPVGRWGLLSVTRYATGDCQRP